ncbi:protein kinase domain-containing protein [Nakamurella deserti]|uniref:protein kinase domain-containing protein n=1 Tax=Nakamurella deserti TaxID=2164074 RepID=UPI000DBE4224|nr:protein kinase [Nakamurella deserti]
MALHPGLVLSNRYRLTRRIAVGGMGEVWAATDRTLGRDIAVKILKSELTSDPEFVGRFRTEAQITASLNNPGIAAVYDYGETASHPDGPQDTAFLVMELVGGEPLSAVLARSPRLPLDRVLDVLEQSGRALQEAHARGLVHRDIKPGNILITPTGQVKITDFGIAKVASQVPVTKGGLVMGTAQYLSPEQAAGDDARPASDVYALGIVGYECLAGFRPFVGDNPVIVAMAQIRNEPPPLPPDVPPAVVELIRHALLKNPAQRYPDGGAFAQAVAAVRAGYAPPPTGSFALPGAAALPPTQVFAAPPRTRTAVAAAPPRPVTSAVPAARPATRPRPKRHTGLSVLIALLILLLAGAVGTALYFQTSSLTGTASSGVLLTPRTSPLDALRESMIVLKSEGWS